MTKPPKKPNLVLAVRETPAKSSAFLTRAPATVANDPLTADGIAAQFAAFEQKICERAEKHALAWVPGYEMSPPQPTSKLANENLAFAVLVAASNSSERVSIEKRDGRWGLWYTHQPSLFTVLANVPRKPSMLLRDASLLTRQKFIQDHAKAFAEQFVLMCNELESRRAGALAAGNEALAFLDNN